MSRVTTLIASIFALAVLAPHACLAEEAQVDTLDYLVQTDDTDSNWILGGFDTEWGKDPEGSGARTLILNKFSSPDYYEVFHVTDSEIRMRYEVMRSDSRNGRDNWIRRFEEIRDNEPGAGAVWLRRFMTPGGEGFISHYRQDRLVYDDKSRGYIYTSDGSGKDFTTYVSVQWAQVNWGSYNKSGFKLDKVLRLVSEWQPDGVMIETYDYARGKGTVNWRWLELLSSLQPVESDKTGHLFHCENGCVRIVSRGSQTQKPVIFKYDLASATCGRQLDVVKMTSHWRKDRGPQWYVVYRELAKEYPITKQDGKINHTYALPEWKSRPNATIADLPYVNTHKPRL